MRGLASPVGSESFADDGFAADAQFGKCFAIAERWFRVCEVAVRL
jgi:hypothetical protein